MTVTHIGRSGQRWRTELRDGADRFVIDLTTREILNYFSFQRAVADQTGRLFVDELAERGGRRGRQAWLDLVGQYLDGSQHAASAGGGAHA